MYLAKFCVSIYLSYLFQILHGRLEISRKFVKSPAKKFILKVNDKSTKIDILRVNNKDTRKTSRTLFQSLYCLLGECFTHCPVVSIVDFEYANAPCLLCSVVLVPLLLALTRYLLLFNTDLEQAFPHSPSISLFKVNKRNCRTMGAISSKLTTRAPERSH